MWTNISSALRKQALLSSRSRRIRHMAIAAMVLQIPKVMSGISRRTFLAQDRNGNRSEVRPNDRSVDKVRAEKVPSLHVKSRFATQQWQELVAIPRSYVLQPMAQNEQ